MFGRAPAHSFGSRSHSSNTLLNVKKPLRLQGATVVRDETLRPCYYLLPGAFSPVKAPPSPDLSVDSVRFTDIGPLAVAPNDDGDFIDPQPSATDDAYTASLLRMCTATQPAPPAGVMHRTASSPS